MTSEASLLRRFIRFIAVIRPGFVGNFGVDDKLTLVGKIDQRVWFQALSVHAAYRRLKLVSRPRTFRISS